MSDVNKLNGGEVITVKWLNLIALLIVLLAIYLTSFYTYLLFHGIAEIISVLIAFSVFLFAWNSREYLKNNYFLFIGIAYLFIGVIDMAHMFAYKGMTIFVETGANQPTQLWIVARYMESMTLLLAFQYIKKKIKPYYLFSVYLLITAVVFSSIFYWEIFPDCFIEGIGLTPFKKVSEYIISVILLVVIAFFFKYHNQFDKKIHRLLVVSVILTIIAELAFTFYINVFGLSNMIGHLFKIVSFYLIYKSIIATGLKEPYKLLFKELKQNENNLRETNQKLNREMSDRSKLEKELRKSEERFHTMFQKHHAVMLLIEPETGSILDANLAARQYYGYSLDNFMELKIQDINMLPSEEVKRLRIKAAEESLNCFIFPHRLSNGEIRKVEVHSSPITIQDEKILFSIIHDVTDREKAENRILESLKEKETLLHEIHHRVKNNMQVIVSLLKLQLNRKDQPNVETILKENMGRVYAMAVIHESLHQSEKLSEIDFKSYLLKLTQMLSQTFTIDPSRVTFQIETPELRLNIDQANPLSLVLNELISNSLKYAFPNDQKGKLIIRSTIRNGKDLELVVEDNGIGMPKGFDWENATTLGLKLVRNLVENQLNGSIVYKNQNGTTFTIKLNLDSNYKI